MRRAWLGCVLWLLYACGGGGDGNDTPVAPGNNVDAGVTTPRDGGTRDAGRDATVVDDELGPVIEFVSPTATSDANSDDVITGLTLDVRCKVSRSKEDGSSPVDPSSVKIQLEDPADNTKLISPAVVAQTSGEYSATFELSALPNGALHFLCSAQDTAASKHVGSATLDTLLDLGPKIEILSPKQAFQALNTALAIEFQVDPAPLADEDDKAEVAEVKLVVAGLDTPIEQTSTGHYTASVAFNDATKFPTRPTDAQVIVTATNKRAPKPATRQTKVDLQIDGTGPVIEIISPKNDSMVRGNVTLVLKVTDEPSGIKPQTLVARIQGDLEIKDWEGMAPTFQQSFDTRVLKSSQQLTFITVNVTAQDTVGNESAPATLTLKLDNMPPLLSFDPPDIWEMKDSSNGLYCSEPFDPVGERSPDDLSRMTNLARFRLLVEDETNHPLGADKAELYFAGVDQTSIKAYMQPSTTPLLIDADGDGTCDEINFDKLEQAQRPIVQSFSPVNPGGTAWYRQVSNKDPASLTSCLFHTDANPAPDVPYPDAYCMTSDLIRVVPGRSQDRPPALYALNPSNAAMVGVCAGQAWPFLSIAHDGFICLAARGVDKIGNVGVSAPLRICYNDPTLVNGVDPLPACWAVCGDDKEHPGADPAACAAMAPSCTDHCTISDAQKFSVPANDTSWHFQ